MNLYNQHSHSIYNIPIDFRNSTHDDINSMDPKYYR